MGLLCLFDCLPCSFILVAVVMRFLSLILLYFILPLRLDAQHCDPQFSGTTVPKKSFEIVSILVDACDGNNEGQNEMIRLKTGQQYLNVKDFNIAKYNSGMVNWGSSSNPWRNFTSINNSVTAKVNTLNANIRNANNCGFFRLLTPQDKIPPYSDVLIITSTDFNPNAHDFAGLNDTVFLLIQNKGNTAGHFANYSGTSATRKLILFNGNQSDTVVYNVNNLIKKNGAKGSEDGAGVEFTFLGSPTYVNYGCKIPYPNFKLDAGQSSVFSCLNPCVNLKGMVEGYACVRWYSTMGGSFSDTSNMAAVFCVPPTNLSRCVVYLEGKSSCGKKEIDSVVLINQSAQPKAFFQVDSTFKPLLILKNSSMGADEYQWNISFPDGIDTQFATKNQQDFPQILSQYPGKYIICLVASSGQCRDTFCCEIIVSVEEDSYVYLANVFTPEAADGLNDELKIESKGLITSTLRIYNRWGVLMFNCNDNLKSWNGKVQNEGEMCPAGTYFYVLDYQLSGQPPKTIKGSINLIR